MEFGKATQQSVCGLIDNFAAQICADQARGGGGRRATSDMKNRRGKWSTLNIKMPHVNLFMNGRFAWNVIVFMHSPLGSRVLRAPFFGGRLKRVYLCVVASFNRLLRFGMERVTL